MRRLQAGVAVLGIAALAGYVSVVLRLTRHPVFLRWGFPQADFLPFFLAHFAFLFLLTLLAARWIFRIEYDDRLSLGLVIGFAVVFRLLLLQTPPVLSSDIFRYVWDGRVQASGFNPYLTTPADVATEEVKQGPLYQQQNRPAVPTIYPPLAQLAFRAVHSVAGESVFAMKALMVAADLCTLALLLQFLSRLGLPRSRVILYAWHPLAVFECAGSGHVDALVLPLILVAVLAWHRGYDTAAGVALGAAVLIKVYPILLLPVFFAKRRWRLPLVCMLMICFCYLPYLHEAGLRVLGYLPRFLVDPGEVFNPSIMGLAILLGRSFGKVSVTWVSWMGKGLLLATLLSLLRSEPESPEDLLARVWLVGTAMVLLALTLHPWYLLWLLPFLVIQPRPAWTYLSAAIAASYLFYLVPTTWWPVIGAVEYAPFLGLLASRRGARAFVPA